MTTAQVVKTSVTVSNNSPIQDYVHPDDQTQPTFEMTRGFKPFTQLTLSLLVVARRNPQKIEFRFVKWPKMITVLCKSSTEKLPLNGDTSAFRQRIIIRYKAMSIYHKIPENSSLDVLKWNTCFGSLLHSRF